MIAILENTCEQAFTYSIRGDKALYLGPGDRHDKKYDDFEVTTGWNAFLGGNFDGDIEKFDGDGSCAYRVRVYPTKVCSIPKDNRCVVTLVTDSLLIAVCPQEMENAFLTKTPMYFTIVLVATFLFTSLVFIYYDHYQEKRQLIIMKQAIRSTGVVNALFPAEVRGRLFEDNVSREKTNAYLKDDETPAVARTKCIADSYDNATVMFGDLAGFTAWSNGREPKDVFNLLETLVSLTERCCEE